MLILVALLIFFNLRVVDIVSSLSAIAQENAASTEETSAMTEEVLATMLNLSEIGITV